MAYKPERRKKKVNRGREEIEQKKRVRLREKERGGSS